MRQIAAASVHSRDQIAKRLKGAGVQLRSHNPAMRKSLNQVEILKLVKNMRNNGKTYRDIAIELEKINAKSKTGKKQWHPMMVKRILMFGERMG